jgi:hypothetical protein
MNEKVEISCLCSGDQLPQHKCETNYLGAIGQLSQDCLNISPARACVWDNPDGILPRQLNRSTGPISCLNRSAPDGTVPSPLRRIIKRAEKHGRWITETNKPTCSKRRHALIASTASNVVCHARDKGLMASDWLRCAERHENAYGSSQAAIRFKCETMNSVMGLLSRSGLNPATI